MGFREPVATSWLSSGANVDITCNVLHRVASQVPGAALWQPNAESFSRPDAASSPVR